MPITFHCPQGHRLSCADELAGKPGKCPKCGVVVRVPPLGASVETATAPDRAEADRAEAAPDASAVAAHEIEAAGDDVTGSDLGADQIIFLCPNGHRLHGSATLAGRPGQCPHCGIRFLVPSPDEEEDEEQVIEDNSPDVRFDDIVIQIDTSGKGGSSKAGKSGAGKSGAGKSSAASGPQLPAAAPATASLLAQLWRYKAQGASVEIHLGDGKMLEPDQISLKDAHHALFAAREANGSQTVTAVAWSAIERIVVRGLEQLPKEWF